MTKPNFDGISNPAEVISLNNRHIPRPPRTHDGKGKKVEEAVQCDACLEAWPCTTHRLIAYIYNLGGWHA